MNEQGYNRTHTIPKKYNGKIRDYILDTPKTIVDIKEIESIKIWIAVEHTTLSGC